jgi:hypothetical protein
MTKCVEMNCKTKINYFHCQEGAIPDLEGVIHVLTSCRAEAAMIIFYFGSLCSVEIDSFQFDFSYLLFLLEQFLTVYVVGYYYSIITVL